MKTVPQYYRVDRRHINFIKFIFEAYEGIALVTTLNGDQGLIRLAVAPGCETIVMEIMADLSESIYIVAKAETVENLI